MKYVVNRIIELIMDNEPSKDKETMIRVDGFDSIKIYEQVASKLSEELLKEGLSLDIKLAKNKWNAFKKKSDNTTILQSMMQHNWVAEEDSMTHYRNLHDSNVVVLLGTEDEEDKGGLANFQSITPDILIKTLNGKYHLIFNDDSLTDSDNEVIDRLYKDLFEFEAIDICKLSDIADSWNGKISNSKDFIELFFNELPTWGLPLRRLELPKRQEIMGRKNVLAGCHRFIVRQPFNSKAFTEFAYAIANEGFYTCLAKDCSEISKLCSAYANLGKYLRERTFPENLKWTLDAYINSFNIIGDISVFEAEKEIESCIVPAWHPATLEKINDQKIFFLDGCGEWWNEAQEKEKITEKEISDTLSDLLQMSMLQSTLDLFPSYGQVYFGTIASYGAFSLYGRNDIKNENRLRDMIHKDAIFDDDFDKNEVARLNDNAKMIYGVMLDYAKAFPNSADNLSLVFIDPSELQPIVAAIYKYIDARRKNNTSAKVDISMRILVKPENKGGRNYLAYWMDEFFSQDENVNIHTYLNEWNSKSQLEKLLNGNNDIAFVMDILKVNNLGFVASHSNESLAPSQCRFPIVYKPTPISSTSVKRTIELSQPQFKAAYEHTQIVRYRNNMEKIPDEMYIASKEVSIDSDGQAIVHFLHEKAYWVVCVDSGMDGA